MIGQKKKKTTNTDNTAEMTQWSQVQVFNRVMLINIRSEEGEVMYEHNSVWASP